VEGGLPVCITFLQDRTKIMESPAQSQNELDNDQVKDAVILVQFFGLSEVEEAFTNANLLISRSFREQVLNLEIPDKGTLVCFLVLHDAKSLVGKATIDTKEIMEIDVSFHFIVSILFCAVY
jgi:hypothetical protein